jgi:hypothetical protein
MFKRGLPRPSEDGRIGGFATQHGNTPAEGRATGPRDQAAQAWTLPTVFYQTFLRNNYTYVGMIILVAIIGSEVFNGVIDGYWSLRNRGKSWEEIKGNYPALPPGTETEEEEEEEE